MPGGSNNNNYGNVQLIVQVADRAAVNAVWPGWCALILRPLIRVWKPKGAYSLPLYLRPALGMAVGGHGTGSLLQVQLAQVRVQAAGACMHAKRAAWGPCMPASDIAAAALHRGHASEKPELPQALAETPSGIRFLGPPAGPMAALGDKIGSTILAQVRARAFPGLATLPEQQHRHPMMAPAHSIPASASGGPHTRPLAPVVFPQGGLEQPGGWRDTGARTN